MATRTLCPTGWGAWRMDDFPIPEVDRQRIETMVAQYRHSIENLYRLAHTQGAIDEAKEALAKLKARGP